MRKLKLQELERVNVKTFKNQTKVPIVLVLDNIRSALNVGSAFRTADCFSLEKIYLCGISAQPPQKEITKTAIGATESMDWIYEKEVMTCIENLKAQNYTIIPVEQAKNSTSLENFELPQNEKLALVFGNEVDGVSQSVMSKVETCIEIPQFGTKHSLNISVSIGIVIWDLFKKYKYK